MTGLRPYTLLKTGAAGRLMDRVALAISADARATAMLAHPQAQVMSDIKARVKSSGSVAIKALYWSVRCPDASVWGGLRTRTLLGDAERLVWVDLMRDPALPALAGMLLQPGHWQVLRYVPLRRATLLHRPPQAPARIIKVKRPDRAADAARRLAAVNAALGANPRFGIPRLLASHHDGTLALSLCKGGPASAQHLRQIGQMHASLHACAVANLPIEQYDSSPADLSLAIALRPDLACALGALARALRNRPLPTAPVLCHGDLGFDQILHHDGGVSLVDFDRCHTGEAAADIAHFLLAIREQRLSGLTPAAAEATYLDGYRQIRALPSPERLDWFRAEALAARVLVTLRKDAPDQTDGLLRLLDAKVLA